MVYSIIYSQYMVDIPLAAITTTQQQGIDSVCGLILSGVNLFHSSCNFWKNQWNLSTYAPAHVYQVHSKVFTFFG